MDIDKIGDAKVLAVEIVDGEIIHYTRRVLALGSEVASVDAERRWQHSRLHSVGHLVGHALESPGWRAVKVHYWPGEARVIFKRLDDAQAVDVPLVKSHCDEMIARDLPCKIQVNESQFRQVGFGDLKPYGCGGTHVAWRVFHCCRWI